MKKWDSQKSSTIVSSVEWPNRKATELHAASRMNGSFGLKVTLH